MKGQMKYRWLIALSAVGIHISIGSVYAWSVFTNPLQQQMGWGLKQISFTFSLAILFLGLSAAFLGHFVEKFGPRVSGMLSSLFLESELQGLGQQYTLNRYYYSIYFMVSLPVLA